MALSFLQITAIALILHAIALAKASKADDDKATSNCLKSPTVIDCKQFGQCCINECVTEKNLTSSKCEFTPSRNEWSCTCGSTLQEIGTAFGEALGSAVGLGLAALIGIIVGGIVLLALIIGGIICCICCCVRQGRQQGMVVVPAGQQVQYSAQYKSNP